MTTLPTSAKAIILALLAVLAAAIGYAVILHIEAADARAEVKALEYEVEQRHIAAETALFTVIEAQRKAIAEWDSEIEVLMRRDSVLTRRVITVKNATHEKRIEIFALDSAGIGHALRGVFARRGQGQ